MANNITIAQGDYGLVIRLNLLKEDNSPLLLSTTDNIEAHIQLPDGECIPFSSEYLNITNRTTGAVRIVIPEEYTREEGYYQIFIELKSTAYKINAKQSIGYYVNARHNIGIH